MGERRERGPRGGTVTRVTAGCAVLLLTAGCGAGASERGGDGATEPTLAGATLAANSGQDADRGGQGAAVGSESGTTEAAQTDASAEQFTATWFHELNAGYRSGDPSRFMRLSGADCTGCADFEANLASLTVAAQRVQHDPFEVAGLAATGADTGVAVVTMTYRVHPGQLSTPTGLAAVTGEDPATIRAAVTWTGNDWLMGELGQ